MGPAVGAVLYILVSEALRAWLGQGHLVFFGVLIIVIILFFPNGIVGTWKDRQARKAKGAAAAGTTPAGGGA